MHRQYNPKRVAVSWAGINFVGFMDGTFVSVDMDEDAVTKKVGSQGDTVATLNANLGAGVMVTLLQMSPTNDQLTLKIPDPRRNLLPTGEFQIKDLNGNTLIHAAVAWIKKPPKGDYGKEVTGREWAFDLAEVDTYKIGGSDT